MIVFTLIFLIVLLLLKGFFSGSEIALVSVDRIRLRHKAEQGSKGARLADRLLKNPARLLTTTLLGTNITSVALTTVGTMLMVQAFGGSGELIALLVYTPLFLILGEIVPKSIYQQRADDIVPVIAYPLSWLKIMLAPLIWLFSSIAIAVARMVGGGPDTKNAAREQFLATVQIAEKTSSNEAFSRGQVRSVLRYAQMTAAEAMSPLSDIELCPENAPMSDLLEVRRRMGQRIIPLYREHESDIVTVAVLDSWDVLKDDIETRDVAEFHGKVGFVPHLQRVSEILELLRREPERTLIVVDALGGAMGFITSNLLVRQTLGADIGALSGRAAGAGDVRGATTQPDGSVLLDARMPVVKVNEALSISLPTLSYSTFGGYALSQFRRLPEVGEKFSEQGHVFQVTKRNERMILQFSARRGRSDA